MAMRRRIARAVTLLRYGRWDDLRYAILSKVGLLDFGPVDVATLGFDPARGFRHDAGDENEIVRIFAELNVRPTDCVIDLGCGKGHAIAALARLPFAEVAGLELSEELASIAARNLSLLGLRKVRIIRGDAADFEDFDRFTHVYMFNPFPAAVMQRVMANLASSMRRCPRALHLVYVNPTCHEVILESGLFQSFRGVPHRWLSTNVYVASFR